MIQTNPSHPNFPPTAQQAAGMRQAINLDNVPNVNATNCDNHVDGTTNKVFTAVDENQLSTNTADIAALLISTIAESDIDTLAKLNAIITDADLIDTNDSRLHSHANKAVLDAITDAGSGQIITAAERTKVGNVIESKTTGEPTGAAAFTNAVTISEADYATALSGGQLVAGTIYFSPVV